MSPQDAFATALTRLALTPNIIRTRRADEVRASRMVADRDAILLTKVAKIKREIAELEKALV